MANSKVHKHTLSRERARSGSSANIGGAKPRNATCAQRSNLIFSILNCRERFPSLFRCLCVCASHCFLLNVARTSKFQGEI